MGLNQSASCNTNTIIVNFDNCKSYDEYFKRNTGIIIEPKSQTLIIEESQIQPVEIVKQGGGKSRNQDSLSSLGFDDDFLKIDSDIEINNEILRNTPQTSEIYPKRTNELFDTEHGTESYTKPIIAETKDDDKQDDSDEDLENLDEDIFNDSTTEETPKKYTPKNVNSDSSTNILPKYIKKKHDN